jgi:hypothetical protein
MENLERRRALLAMFAGGAGVAACATTDTAVAQGGDNHRQQHEATMRDLATRLDATESRFTIAETLYNYARACDRADEAMMRGCFWPESTHKHGRFDGTSTDFVNFAFRIISSLKYAAHHISNVSTDVRGDRGVSECYYFAHHRRDVANGTGEEDVFMQGRYIDLHERRNGVWKIIRRRGLSDYTSAPVPANVPFAQWPADQRSGRAPADDYYAMKQAFLSGG